jgi:DNA repair exonuclease SbcCD nuclease subunit
MNYYAGGHWHEYESIKHENNPLIYPGSTEYSDIKSMENQKPRGFIHYKDKPVFIKLKTREVKVEVIDCNGLSPEQVTETCNKSIKDSDKGLIILKLKGTLGQGKRNEVDIKTIKARAVEKGWLHCNIKLSDLKNPGDKSISTGSKTLQEIESEFLKSKGYKPKEVELARKLIELLGNNYNQTELEKVMQRTGELIDN